MMLTNPDNLEPGVLAVCRVVAYTTELTDQAILTSGLEDANTVLPSIILQTHGAMMLVHPAAPAGVFLLPKDCPEDVIALACAVSNGDGEHVGTICNRHLLTDASVSANLKLVEEQWDRAVAQMMQDSGIDNNIAGPTDPFLPPAS